MLAKESFYEEFIVTYANAELLVYFVDGRDGTSPYGVTRNYYVVSGKEEEGLVAAMLRQCGTWATSLHDEIWVFNGGFWSKDAELYRSVMKCESRLLPKIDNDAVLTEVQQVGTMSSCTETLKKIWWRL